MRLVGILAALSFLPVAAAQDSAPETLSGTIAYEITTRLDIDLPPELQHMADQFPSSNTQNKLLHFTESASLLVTAPAEEDAEEDTDFSSRGMRVMFRRSAEDNALFVDRDANRSVERRDFMGRTFLIDGEPEPMAWRLTDEQSEFLGYPCMKAIATVQDTVQVEAWFTPQIPVSAGPDTYGGLPGLILVLTVDDARQTYIAREVTLGPLAEGTLSEPEDGRRVTRERFDEIMEERLNEMRRRGGFRLGN
ncbi:MAG: GLPGLI family protein [Bacteroidota bacterium]